jgi:hypothetical protein
MTYSEALIDNLINEYPTIVGELDSLATECFMQGEKTDNARIEEHLHFGAVRRVRVLKRSLENIFTLFPPTAKQLLGPDELSDVQINLHAFVMNLYGVFDNWAWAFVIRHDLEAAIGKRQRIGLFIEATKKYLPPNILSSVSDPANSAWYEKYLKSYRDALAHRIPLYIPPADFTPEDSERFNQLQRELGESLRSSDLGRHMEAKRQQMAIGRPSFKFLTTLSDADELQPLWLHPQILTDARTVAEFGLRFLANWHERA